MTPIENCLIKLNLDGILCIDKNHTVEKIFIYEGKVFELYYTKSKLQLTSGDLNFMQREDWKDIPQNVSRGSSVVE